MKNTYIERDGVLYKEHWYEDNSGPISFMRKTYIRSRRKTYKDTWQYKLWYWMPAIIQAGYQLFFAIVAVGAVIMTAVTFWAMWNALV